MMNKKANIFGSFIVLILVSLMYFVIGLPIIRSILNDAVLPQLTDPVIIFLVKLSPFIPIIGILLIGYFNATSNKTSNESSGGFQ